MPLHYKSRRQFLESIGNAGLGALGYKVQSKLPRLIDHIPQHTKHILLRSSWQTINIGDIAHTPGVLHLLEKHLPEVKVTLWAADVRDGVEEMIQTRFPQIPIIKDDESELLQEAFAACDFLLHGSGPFLVGRHQVDQWHRETGKPYGVYGITFSEHREQELMIRLLTGAEFVFFRDSVSLTYARSKGVQAPVMAFGPDGAFAVDLRNDEAALAFLKEHDLEPGKFLCVIPRYRHTPSWTIPSKNRAFNPEYDAKNHELKEQDHQPLRKAIIAIIEKTDFKVLICAEDVTQIKIGKEMLYDPLPAEIRKRVVWRDRYWLTDEALSTYIRSAGIFGLEMHSPIMCIGNGIPALVGRFKEQTSKGFMWKDIGLEEWLFDMDSPSDIARYVPTVLDLVARPMDARAKANRARKFVEEKQLETMEILRKSY